MSGNSEPARRRPCDKTATVTRQCSSDISCNLRSVRWQRFATTSFTPCCVNFSWSGCHVEKPRCWNKFFRSLAWPGTCSKSLSRGHFGHEETAKIKASPNRVKDMKDEKTNLWSNWSNSTFWWNRAEMALDVFRNAYQSSFCDSLEFIILEHPTLGKEFIWALMLSIVCPMCVESEGVHAKLNWKYQCRANGIGFTRRVPQGFPRFRHLLKISVDSCLRALRDIESH